VVGEVVQRVDRCAVEVLDCCEVDGKPCPAGSGLCGGGGERLVEAVDVAEVDFPRRGEDECPVVAARGVERERRGHHAILAVRGTVVPEVSGLIATSGMSPRITAMPRPRFEFAAGCGVFQEPLSVIVNCTRSTSAVAAMPIVPSGLWR